MSDEVFKDVWSKQFYKALEAVGNLTEQERLKLGNMLIALSGVKEKQIALKREIPPYNTNPLRNVGGYQPIKSETLDEVKSPPKKP